MSHFPKHVCAASAESGSARSRCGALRVRRRPAEDDLEAGYAAASASLGRPMIAFCKTVDFGVSLEGCFNKNGVNHATLV